MARTVRSTSFTMVGESKVVGAHLNKLIELGLDAVSAYDAAIDHIDDLDDKACFEGFRGVHERQVHDLQSLVSELGEEPIEKAQGLKRHLKNLKVILASLIGDRLVLLAMKSVEHENVTAYDKVLGRTDLPPHVRELLHRFREHEHGHVEDLERRLDEFDMTEKETFTPPPSVR